jgi:hypothetical protein
MKARTTGVMLVGALAFLWLTLIIWSDNVPAVAAEAGLRTKEKGLLESRDEMVAAYKSSVARVVSVLADRTIRESDRPTTVAAIELAGELRAKEAVPYLVELLLYGKKKDITERRETPSLPPPPDKRAPALQALIDIGVPSLAAVREKLVSASASKRTETTDTLRLHCVWVIWKVLGTDLGKEYLVLCQEKNPEPKGWFDDAMGFFTAREKMDKAEGVKKNAAIENRNKEGR